LTGVEGAANAGLRLPPTPPLFLPKLVQPTIASMEIEMNDFNHLIDFSL
jgi:hypothetical protein